MEKHKKLIPFPENFNRINKELRSKEGMKRDKEALRAILGIQTEVMNAIEEFFYRNGFYRLMPVMLAPNTDPLGPDPKSSVVKTPEIEYYGQKLKVTQSMILHKQIAIAEGLDKIYVLSPNIRLEKAERASTGKHLIEFSQADFEIADAKMKDIFDLVEELYVMVVKRIIQRRRDELEILGRELRVPKRPFKRYTSHEMEEEYGRDWEIKASKDHKDPFWVICHKREFYDREDPERPGHYRNYDLIYPEGFGEALSGGEREWEYKRILARIEKDGLSKDDYREYLTYAKRGLLRPSAGAGLGVERFVRYIAGAKHIGDIQLFRRVPGERITF